MGTGVLSDTDIEGLVTGGGITLSEPLVEGQVQPASLDLRLGDRAYRVRASFLTGKNSTVEDRPNQR